MLNSYYTYVEMADLLIIIIIATLILFVHVCERVGSHQKPCDLFLWKVYRHYPWALQIVKLAISAASINHTYMQ